ncbi:MAG: hypothetical protein ACRC9R_02020 [Enterovibrio sp.]
MFPLNFPNTSGSSSAARQTAARAHTPRLPFAAVRRAPFTLRTSTTMSPTPSSILLAQRQARRAGVRQPQPAAPVQRYFPAPTALGIARYTTRVTPRPQAAAPAALTAAQVELLNTMLEITGNPNAADGQQASQERVRQRAISAFAQVLNLNSNRVDRHVPVGRVAIRTVITNILLAERRLPPSAIQMLQLIQAFINIINQPFIPPAPQQNVPRGPGPNNGPGAGGAAAQVAPPQEPPPKSFKEQLAEHLQFCKDQEELLQGLQNSIEQQQKKLVDIEKRLAQQQAAHSSSDSDDDSD